MGGRGQSLARCCGERAAFPHTPPSILSTQPSVALAPALGPEEMSAAGAHSCSPCSIYCFQFNVRRSWAGQHGGNMVMPSCAKPAWTKILPSHLGLAALPLSRGKTYQETRIALWGWSCHNIPVFLGSRARGRPGTAWQCQETALGRAGLTRVGVRW